ncbi:DNA polymerase III subunit delta' [soil metagenome]
MTVWDALAGSRAADGLAAQVSSGAPAQAWLLAGPPGSGKRQAAVAIAAAFNCSLEPGRGCGRCPACARILRGRHPDVHHIVPEGPLIPVDVIREAIIPEAARSPFEAPYKVFIVEEAERMNPNAQNALLKTLEEPQPDTIFVLTTESEDELLDTVRSRCRMFRLDPVPESRIIELLEAEGVEGSQARLAARVAEGDYARARSLALDAEVSRRREMWLGLPMRLGAPSDVLDMAQEVLDAVREAVARRLEGQKQEVAELADAMGEGRGTAGARNSLAKRHRRELRRLEIEVLGEAFGTLGSLWRDLLVTRRGSPEAITNLDRLDELRSLADTAPRDADLVAAMERCGAARSALERNANAQLLVEATLLDLGRLIPTPPAKALT